MKTIRTQAYMREWLGKSHHRRIVPTFHVSGWRITLYQDSNVVSFAIEETIEEAFTEAEIYFDGNLRNILGKEIASIEERDTAEKNRNNEIIRLLKIQLTELDRISNEKERPVC